MTTESQVLLTPSLTDSRSAGTLQGEPSIVCSVSSIISCSTQVLHKTCISVFLSILPSYLLRVAWTSAQGQIPPLQTSVTSRTRAHVKMEAWSWERKPKRKWDRGCSVSFKLCGRCRFAEERGYRMVGKAFPPAEQKVEW